ncbi:hypothetical protein PGTUg99_018648 [Puccinia graminis f. sp. tritici]|uniref:Uncharacterized protein n=1 Tax=Puccinia graminis f. sp. tritici TaxID=56615 RepID=A0A5B0REE0_PUCGR|nr:hypothetical protein PGTUg99_018648 [Puccinia graminis f. sp. tritici]
MFNNTGLPLPIIKRRGVNIRGPKTQAEAQESERAEPALCSSALARMALREVFT